MLNFKLFPYQETGVRFLCNTKKCLLADEMGLGKTVQVLEAVNRLTMQGDKTEVLIVCPASLVLMWVKSIQEWYSGGTILLHKPKQSVIRFGAPCKLYFTIVSYNFVQKALNVAKLFNTLWTAIVADEAHFLKNFKSKTCKGFRNLSNKSNGYMWLLSGTPATRNGQDYYPYLEICMPGKWGNLWQFSHMFCNVTVDWMGHKKFTTVKDGKIPLLKAAFKRIMLRRLKKDVLTELPSKLIKTIPVEVCEDLIGQCLDLDSQLVYRCISEDKPLPAHVASTLRAIGLAKVPSAVDYILGVTEPLVVFCAHTDVVNEICMILEKESVTYGKITGSENTLQKQTCADDFQSGKIKVVVANIKAGGVGITLTASSHMLVVEQNYSPAVMSQVLARIDRIGQKAECLQITNLIAPGTIDDVITQVLKEKRYFMEKVMGDVQ